MVTPVVLIYLTVGVLFGLFFSAKGAGMLDPVANDATVGFKILIFPASVALWPLLLLKLKSGRGEAA